MVYSRPYGRLAQRESAAFTRQRSLVRTQHRPLVKVLQMAEKKKPPVFEPGALYCNRTATRQNERFYLITLRPKRIRRAGRSDPFLRRPRSRGPRVGHSPEGAG